MSQMRKDIFTGSWVIVAETNTVRPSDFHFKRFARGTMFCPFCETNEAATPLEVFAIRNPGSSPNGPGWSVRVVSNSNPLLRIEGELGRRAEGFHDLMNGVGAHEIIVETPRHDRSLHELEVHELSDVIRAYVARIIDLEGDNRAERLALMSRLAQLPNDMAKLLGHGASYNRGQWHQARLRRNCSARAQESFHNAAWFRKPWHSICSWRFSRPCWLRWAW